MNAKTTNNCHKKSKKTLKSYENNVITSIIISYEIYTQRYKS